VLPPFTAFSRIVNIKPFAVYATGREQWGELFAARIYC
jgi:hypothetical protein